MLRPSAVIFGLILLIMGILAFIPQLLEAGNLFNLFRFNFEDRMGLIFAGILGVLCGLYSRESAKKYFIIVGIIYAILAILGFYIGQGMVLGMFASNIADSWFHAGVATAALYLGFSKT